MRSIPPPIWGIRIGEIVHNMRSALDHIVWELVILNTSATPRTKQNQFPIFETEPGFDDRGVKKFLVHVSQAAIDAIKDEQRFRTGEEVKSPLWHLKELSDVDKHRTLHVTGTMVRDYKALFPSVVHQMTISDVKTRAAGPIQEDTVLWRGRFDTTADWPFVHRQVQAQLTVDIAFDHGTPAVGGWLVYKTLVDIADRVDRVAKRIARELFSIDL